MILEELVGLMDIGCDAMGKTFEGLRVCELGDQRMKWHPLQTGKKYLAEKGVVEHISLDWNGKNGALKRDLGNPIDEWDSYFDMVTNFGTVEHIDDGQYNAFKNIHNFTNVGGVMVHAFPLVECWIGHCDYHYESDFPETLASLNDYKCVLSEVRKIIGRRGRRQLMVCTVLLKNKDEDFMTEDKFKKMGKIKGL